MRYRRVARLGAHAAPPVFDLKEVAVEVGDTLFSLDRLLQIAERIANERFDLAPEEARVVVGNVAWRAVSQALVAADFSKLAEQGIELARILGIGELANKVGGAN
jgi:hypothetical protein